MNTHRISGLVISGLGLLLFFVAIPLGIDSPTNVKLIALAPGFWPKIIAGIIILAGVWLGLSKDSMPPRPRRELAGRLRLLFTLGCLFSFYYGIPYLGMVVPGMLLLFVLMAFAGERRWLRMALLSVGVPLLLYLFFAYLANIPIPLGVFEALRG